ncbi:MAG: hypothetical protein ACTSYR_04700 [Candidatus Odinarchaeia archaeon]
MSKNGNNKLNYDLDFFLINTVKSKKKIRVRDLVKLACKKYDINESEVLKVLQKLNDEKHVKINLNEDILKNKELKLNKLINPINQVNYVIILLSIISLIVVLTIPEDLPPLVYLRWFFGGIQTLILPGYSIQWLLFNGRGYDSLEITGLTVGLSIVTSSIIIFIYYLTPIGLNIFFIIITLVTLTILANIFILKIKISKL